MAFPIYDRFKSHCRASTSQIVSAACDLHLLVNETDLRLNPPPQSKLGSEESLHNGGSCMLGCVSTLLSSVQKLVQVVSLGAGSCSALSSGLPAERRQTFLMLSQNGASSTVILRVHSVVEMFIAQRGRSRRGGANAQVNSKSRKIPLLVLARRRRHA